MNRIELYEVGPRDGFQNVREYIPLETKLEIIDGLIATGIRHLQITSFVSPKAVPQMKDAREVTEQCVAAYPDIDMFALVPNLRGAEAAWDSGLKRVTYVVSLSESHNRANIRRTHEESFAELDRIRSALPDLEVAMDLSTAFGCPFEGAKTADDVVPFLQPYIDGGIRSVTLCDTIGIANPARVRNTVRAVRSAFPELDLQIHIHDTRNMGMVNTLVAIEEGVQKVQATLGGLGGCPFAPGASGNLATEDVAFMLTEMGYDLGIDVPQLVELARRQAGAIPTGQFSGHLYTIRET
ncbi:MAG: hydroxymethylglutaryl-CoA lyase [Alkalispirochaeta sp.]